MQKMSVSLFHSGTAQITLDIPYKNTVKHSACILYLCVSSCHCEAVSTLYPSGRRLRRSLPPQC